MKETLDYHEVLSRWENGEIEDSIMKHVFIGKSKNARSGKELTALEQKLWSKECRLAKIKELASFVANDAFEIVHQSTATVRPQSSRWVLSWKELPGGHWTVKARLVVRG